MQHEFIHLQEKQQQHLPHILRELQTHGRKINHWAWWVFPTDLAGRSEPLPKTCVQPEERSLLLNGSTAHEWQLVLEKIASLIEQHQSWNVVLPPIDHGRVRFFIRYWSAEAERTQWLNNVLRILRENKGS